jgi:hypothetical protein
VLELISPAGLEQFFRWLGELDEFPSPDVLAEKARPYRCDVDETATAALMERLGMAPYAAGGKREALVVGV